MTPEALRDAVLRALRRVAPECDVTMLDPARPMREQVDLDSMDFLNVLIAVHRETGVEVPEAEYGAVATLDGCVAYLARRLAAGTRADP